METTAATASAPAEPMSTPAVALERHKLTVDGQELELSLDELKSEASKGRSAYKKWQEAAQKQKAVDQFVARLKSGDMDFLDEIVGDEQSRKWAEKKLSRWVELQEMSPEARENLQLKSRLAAEEKDKAERTERETHLAHQRGVEHATQEIDGEVSSHFNSIGKKPTPRLLARMAEYMLASLERDGPRMSASDAYKQVVGEIPKDFTEFLGHLDPEEARKLLPKSLLEAWRRRDIDEAKAKDPFSGTRSAQDQPRGPSKSQNRRMTTDDFFSRLEKRLG